MIFTLTLKESEGWPHSAGHW